MIDKTLTQLRDAIASKQLTATKVVQSCLDHIEKQNPAIHAYHQIFADRSLERAAEVDAGSITGPLAGVPIAIKDNLCTSFGHTT